MVLVAGLPGAGKSTLLSAVSVRTPNRGYVVLDADSVREVWRARLPRALPYRGYRPLIHFWHRVRIVAALIGGPAIVVVHLPATSPATRVWIATLATITRRQAHLLWLDATPAQARRGQADRGRTVAARSFRRHVARGATVAARLHAGQRPRGWASACLVPRDQARCGLCLDCPNPPSDPPPDPPQGSQR